MTDDAQTIRAALERRAAREAYDAELGVSEFEAFMTAEEIEARAALDRLLADRDRLTAERDRLQHFIDCADTPLMRDVLRDRDRLTEQHTALEARLRRAVEGLGVYGKHRPDCGAQTRGGMFAPGPCTCGLATYIAEIDVPREESLAMWDDGEPAVTLQQHEASCAMTATGHLGPCTCQLADIAVGDSATEAANVELRAALEAREIGGDRLGAFAVVSLTVGQTDALLSLLEYGAKAIKFGLGSGGNPAGPDVYLVQPSGRALWIRPDGSVEDA